MALSW